MRRLPLFAAVILVALTVSPASAQRLSFQRAFDTPTAVTLDVSTLRGGIVLRPGPPGQVMVHGTATVRVAIDTPAHALELTRGVAASPPIEREGDVIRLRPPSATVQQRAMTIAYEVVIPPGTSVRAESNSGEIAATGLSAATSLSTQSGKVGVTGATAAVSVSSQSGEVRAHGVAADLTITTGSSAIDVREAGGTLRVKTQSGAVTADVAPSAEVEVETGSSAISVTGVQRALLARSQSGATRVTGMVGGEWQVSTGSGRIQLTVSRRSSARFDVSSRSGAITIPSGLVTSSVSRNHVEGTLGDGANPVRIDSGSGAIRIRFEP